MNIFFVSYILLCLMELFVHVSVVGSSGFAVFGKKTPMQRRVALTFAHTVDRSAVETVPVVAVIPKFLHLL